VYYELVGYKLDKDEIERVKWYMRERHPDFVNSLWDMLGKYKEELLQEAREDAYDNYMTGGGLKVKKDLKDKPDEYKTLLKYIAPVFKEVETEWPIHRC